MAAKPILNIAEVVLTSQRHGEKFEAQFGAMASKIGAEKIGCRLMIVPPEKRGWPFHCHYANEELFFILEGNGTYRIGTQRFPIRAGDLVAAPAGGSDTAHQIINDSDSPLKYLALSTMLEPEVTEYPDSRKYGVFTGAPPGGDKGKRTFSVFAPKDAVVGYWDGES